MKRPSFQFYPADWRNNTKLQRSSFAERGIWLEIMCLMHDSDEYGVLRWPLKEVAQVAGCRLADLMALVKKEVIKGAEDGDEFTGFTYTPRHAGKDGHPVTLIEAQRGPIWFSSRMVLDEYLRGKRGASTRFNSDNNPQKSYPQNSPTPRQGERHGGAPKVRQGERLNGDDSRQPTRRLGDGASSSSSSSSTKDLDLGLSISPTRVGSGQNLYKNIPENPQQDTERIERNRRIGQALAEGDRVMAERIKAGTA